MKIFKKKETKVIVSFSIAAVLILTTIAVVNVIDRNQDTRGRASEEGFPWNIAIVGDTQAQDDQGLYDVMYQQLAAYDPYMYFHVGDDVLMPDMAEQPSRGVWELRDSINNKFGFPMEFHAVVGNHDDTNTCGVFDDFILNALCTGQKQFNCKYIDKSKAPQYNPYKDLCNSDSAEVYKIQDTGIPLNKEVQQVTNYCSGSRDWHQYSFIRSNIRFIMLQMPYYCDVTERIEWMKQEICKPNDADISILFLHEPEFEKLEGMLNGLTCDHNLKLIMAGHGHVYVQEKRANVDMIEVAGSFWVRGDYDGTREDDFWIAQVYQDRIVFKQSIWTVNIPGSTPDDFVERLTIPGNFTKYKSPFVENQDDDDDEITQTVKLKKGASLVNLQLSFDDLKASDLVNKIKEKAGNDINVTIAQFASGKWSSYKYLDGNTYKTEDFTIEDGQGYLVILSKDVEVSLTGAELDPDFTHSLHQGWNLIGLENEAQEELDAETFINELKNSGVEAKIITRMTDGSYRSLIFDQGRVYGSNFKLKSGVGYFVFVEK